MRAVDVSIKPCAGLKLQHLLLFIQGPNTRESRIEVVDQSFRADLQHVAEGISLRESQAEVRRQS